MLNLSDKELDRLSREAANQHDPGDLLGSRSWDRLEFRLDKELGRLSPSPLRGVRGLRRIPFYYAPAILLLIGASYYFIKHGKGNAAKTEPSGSPPTALVKPLSPGVNEPNSTTQTPENSQNSTSKPDKALSADYPAPTPGTATTPNAGATAPNAGATSPAPNATIPASGSTTLPANGTTSLPHSTTGSSNGTAGSPNIAAGSSNSTKGLPNSTTGAAPGTIASSNGSTASSPGTISAPNGTATSPNRSAASPNGKSASSHGTNDISRGASGTPQGITGTAGANSNSQATTTPNHKTGGTGKSFQDLAASSQGTNSRHHRPTGSSQDKKGQPGTDEDDDAAAAASVTGTAGNPAGANPRNQPSATIAPREALSSSIQAPRSLTRSAGIDDASLRAFAAAGKPVATPITLGKKKNASLHIERPLTFGFSVSPDFASVHSVAGDRPGRSIGLTMDYQVLNGFYISTGLLFTRKNYTANPNNFHAPKDYYRTFTSNKIDLIKGSFDMLEIPLNLRYDFRANSNTVFFISGGASSYLLTSEHSQYYFDYFGRPTCLTFDKRLEPKNKNYLFSSVNLSMGVETGISNSLSLLVAPYVKIPTSGMGLGQVQITSVGLNFALRYSPVLSRKRK